MGLGDEIMVTGLVRKARELTPNAQFIVGKKPNSHKFWVAPQKIIFQNSPYLISHAVPRDESKELVYIRDFPGRRGYIDYTKSNGKRVHFNVSYKATPGEIFFSDSEKQNINLCKAIFGNHILVHPYVKQSWIKDNKKWVDNRWSVVCEKLHKAGYKLLTLDHGVKLNDGTALPHCESIETRDFRQTLTVLSAVSLVITTEGGLHHAAAAVGTKAVVIFGGRTSPKTTGYDGHINLYTDISHPVSAGGESISSPCGMVKTCDHCEKCMEMITVDEVLNGVEKSLTIA